MSTDNAEMFPRPIDEVTSRRPNSAMMDTTKGRSTLILSAITNASLAPIRARSRRNGRYCLNFNLILAKHLQIDLVAEDNIAFNDLRSDSNFRTLEAHVESMENRSARLGGFDGLEPVWV